MLKGEQGPRSCTPAGIMALLDRYQIPIVGKKAVVGAGSVVTKNVPAASLALSRPKQLNFKKINQKIISKPLPFYLNY